MEEVTRRKCWQLVDGRGHTASGSAAGRSWHRGRHGRDDAVTAGSANAETEIPRALCRHGWSFDSRERLGWRPGRGPRAEGHLRQLGHSHGGGLPSSVHSRGRSRLDTCCIPVQILFKGQTVRPVWNCSGGALRLASRRLGSPPCRGRKRHLEENHRSGLQGDRKRQILQHGEPQGLLRMVDQDHGATEEVHACRTGAPRPVPIRGGDSQTYGHHGICTVDEDCLFDLQASAATSSSTWRTDWVCLGPAGRSVGLEDVEGCRVPGRTLLGMGNVVEAVDSLRGWTAVAGIEDTGSNRQRWSQAPVTGACVAAGGNESHSISSSTRGHGNHSSTKRERENAEVIGGLRDPRRAVARCKELQQVGRQIRQLLDQSLTDDILTCFENSVDECPFPEGLIWKARYSLTRHFEAEAKDEGYQSDLLRQLLTQAKDPDATVLPAWIEDGFPIGINQQITYTGVFPRSDDLTAAAKASQAFAVMDDWDGKAQNYSSFAEAGDKAQSELDRMVERGWALRKDTWADVVASVGDASLTKMACIVKMKQGREKVRIIVDMRRSGVNGRMSVHERVVLPRVSDVAKCLGELLKHAGGHDVPEFYIIDFSDAFYTLKLHPSERSHTVVKGNDGRYYILLSVCFGLCCGPLVWGRLAAALLRLGQATMESREGRSQCYVDDPLLVAIGPSTRARTAVFARVTLLWCCLGATLAWKKVQRGPKVEWIGVALHLEGERFENLRVSLTPEKTQRLFELFQEIFEAGRNGMISTRRLSQAAGIMGWVSNLVPVARPWTAALWGALTTASQEGASIRSTTRRRKGLTFWKQVSWAITGLHAMLVVGANRSHEPVVNLSPILDSPTPIPEVPCSLSKVFLFGDHLPLCELWTDACPSGVGSFI